MVKAKNEKNRKNPKIQRNSTKTKSILQNKFKKKRRSKKTTAKNERNINTKQ